MVSVAHTPQNIEITAENLREELHRLEAQRQALERELAAVVAHLGSIQTTLGALHDLMPATTPWTQAPAKPAAVPAAGEEGGDTEPSATVSRSAEPRPQQAPAPREPAESTSGTQAKYGRLTEQIADYFAATGNADVRARDVAAALRRDTDAGSINAVRSTLDRLVGTSRIQRTGRGLYRANPS
ncbi:hypothetical protein [Streptomyces sp. NPDC048473]|uniref:hypothetical protein n=1 Tax=unclassified Streptomyces TaxID=2593676 RepID=UPI0037202D17